MPRVSRRVMDMEEAELSAVLAVALPRSRFEGISRDKRQEAVLKWLFSHGLGMSHEFMLDIEDDDIYVLMRNKPCTCCPKLPEQVVSFRRDEKGGNVQLPGKYLRRSSSGEQPTSSATKSDRLAPSTQIRRSKSDETIANPAPLAERRGQKVQPIVTQPQPMATTLPPKKQEQEEESCWRTFWREYGTCCVGLWGNC